MQPEPAADSEFIDAVTHIESRLDGVVDHGNDDELFLASYLQGHFAVIARKQEMDAQATVATLHTEMQQSLDAAFARGELEIVDQQRVVALWQKLVREAR
ncbi:YfcL family protein [Alteromonas pelagimontana]|uniref:YfcL family protein n=1 Tax=Alteromonas pelagimontana TaxID=1858656 RepID=A0A6M4MGN5_9ALTE|nr:YfcL family protein [Alteromonas pelagimontana]QJR82222.1 YfcL family protein [Alteromonas pelagimontana]